MVRASTSVIAAGLIASIAVPVAAQPAGSTITVIGEQREQLRRSISDYVRQIGIAVGEQPAARWIDPICVNVVGVPPAIAERVAAQVRATANSVGAAVAHGKCEPNLLVAFTEDAPALVREVTKRSPLVGVSHEHRAELETGSAPIRWWYSSELRNADGTPMDGAGSPSIQSSSGSVYGAYANFGAQARNGSSNAYTASLVAVPTIRAIGHSTVVIDVNKATGKKLGSVVDYATLVALAEVRPGARPENSVLSLFQSDQSHRLSRSDRAMLSALYGLHLGRTTDQQRRSLVTTMVNQLADGSRP